MSETFTESEAAAKLRMHPSTLAKLALAGRIGYVPGGLGIVRQRRLYSQEHIEAYLRQRAPVLHDTSAALQAVKATRSSRNLRGRYSEEALVGRGL